MNAQRELYGKMRSMPRSSIDVSPDHARAFWAAAAASNERDALIALGNEIGFDGRFADVTAAHIDGGITVLAPMLPPGQVVLATEPVSEVKQTEHDCPGCEGCAPQEYESQRSISEWADATFGTSTLPRIAIRASLEMHELIEAVAENDHVAMVEEAADVIIVLMRIFHYSDVDFMDVINRKMQKNRARKWTRDGAGSGQHIDEKQT